MKHSAKAAARLARERAKLDRRQAARGDAAGRPGSPVPGSPVPGSLVPGSPVPGSAAPAAPAQTRAAAGAAGGVAHLRLTQLPYVLVLAGIAAGLVLMEVAKDAVRGGTFVIAGALLAGSVTRLALPDSRAGLLRSRRRLVDVAVFGALGAGLLVAGLVVQVPG
jgi:Protein of unknown function (DUF3017)